MTRLPAQFRTSLGPALQLKVLSGRNTSELAAGDDGTEPNSPHPLWVLCSWGEGIGRLWPSWPLFVILYLVSGRADESSGHAFSRMPASVSQSGQIRALGITLVCFKAELVERRFCSALLLAPGAVERDSAGHWAALTSTLVGNTWAEGRVPWKVKDSPFFYAVFLHTPGVLSGLFCCKSA